MDNTSINLNASRGDMSLSELAAYFAPAAGCSFEAMVDLLWEAAIAGEFDEVLHEDGQLETGLLINYRTKPAGLVHSTGLQNLLTELHKDGIEPALVRADLINRGGIALRKEAVWHFCRAHKVAPPAFWPFPKKSRGKYGQRAALTPANRADALKFLMSLEPKSLTTEEIEHKLTEKFNINRKTARTLIDELPEGRIRRQGEKRSDVS